MAQSHAEPVSDHQRIERLAELGRLWGFIKFAHTALAYRDIDWDQALVRALPTIRAARSTEDYTAAVNGMLSALQSADPRRRGLVPGP